MFLLNKSSQKMLLIFSVICALSLAVGTIWRLTKQPATANASKALVIGMMSGWPPFMSINQRGDYEGYDVNVARLVAKRLGRDLEIKDLGAVQTIFIALEQGIIDMAMSGFDRTQKRIQEFNMVRYTSREYTSVALLFWKQIPNGINSLTDLAKAGMTVCVEPGSGEEEYVNAIQNIKKKMLPAITDMVMDLRFGKAAALVVEHQVKRRLSKQILELVSITEQLPKKYAIYGDGIAIKKSNTALAAEVTEVIEQLKKEGVLQQLEQKWQLDGAQ